MEGEYEKIREELQKPEEKLEKAVEPDAALGAPSERQKAVEPEKAVEPDAGVDGGRRGPEGDPVFWRPEWLVGLNPEPQPSSW